MIDVHKLRALPSTVQIPGRAVLCLEWSWAVMVFGLAPRETVGAVETCGHVQYKSWSFQEKDEESYGEAWFLVVSAVVSHWQNCADHPFIFTAPWNYLRPAKLKLQPSGTQIINCLIRWALLRHHRNLCWKRLTILNSVELMATNLDSVLMAADSPYLLTNTKMNANLWVRT